MRLLPRRGDCGNVVSLVPRGFTQRPQSQVTVNPRGSIAWPCPKRVRASHPEGRSGWRLEIAGRIGKTLQSESYERYQELKAVRLQRGKAVWGAHVAL